MRKSTLLLSTLLLLASVSGCQSSATSGGYRYPNIVVYGFSTEEVVFTEEIFPAFEAYWQELTGQEVTVQGVFGPSEEITDAILSGARADVAILSNEQHAVWLQVNDVVQTDWHTFPQGGIVTRSPLVIVVRPGNPLGIRGWSDLARPGISVIHPDPRTSGGAQWALLAEYGAALLEPGGSAEAATEQLQAIWANVVATPASSQDALKQFIFGAGDAMVTYEQDALLAQERGATLEIVMPNRTVMSEHVAVIVDRHVKADERDVVEGLVAYLWSQTAQQSFVRYYFRAVIDEALNDAEEAFHDIPNGFTVQDLGGWGQVYAEVIHGAWEEQSGQ
ncbi:MAG TPA: substrate-binding domain-containing protein [Anaerolineae bacterium]|nr:substrate-binding domain-containing protein [Anaerolineae bacterium]